MLKKLLPDNFPIYQFIHKYSNAQSPRYHSDVENPLSLISPAGRVILSVFSGWPPKGEKRERFLAALTPNDVLYIPFWYDDRGTLLRTTEFDDLMALTREIGPHLRAILVGNNGVEFTYGHTHWDDPKGMIAADVEFVKESSDLLRDAGAKPAYGTVCFDIIHDCYETEGLLRSAMNDADALQIGFCGFCLIPEAYCDWNYPTFACARRMMAERDTPPYAALMDYLDETDMWSGCHGLDGIIKGNARLLAAYGHTGGVAALSGFPGVCDWLDEKELGYF